MLLRRLSSGGVDSCHPNAARVITPLKPRLPEIVHLPGLYANAMFTFAMASSISSLLL
jgi:hypothetical protein